MLEIKNIVKQYAGHRALNDVSLYIPKGKIFGLLGPNGAGKTSLIRIINQITAPDSGEIFLNGEKLGSKHISDIGYLPEERGLYKKMEIGEQMLYLAQLKGMSKSDAEKRIRYWFEKLEIETWWNKKVEELSKGMQQKVQFVSTVLHKPSLLILDEPFSGFDPVNAEIIKNEILQLNQEGATIIFSTHRMESVEELCDSIALLNKSEKILDGTVKEIRNSYKSNTYKIDYIGDLKNISGDFSFHFKLKTDVEGDGFRTATFELHSYQTANELLGALLSRVQIVKLEEVIPSINDIFISSVNKPLEIAL